MNAIIALVVAFLALACWRLDRRLRILEQFMPPEDCP